MCCFDRRAALPPIAALLLLGLAPAVHADHVIGLGAEADSEGSEAFSLFGSFSATDDTWVNLGVSRSQSEGPLFDLENVYIDAGIDHFFDPVGVRLGAAYWGDSDLLDSVDLKGALYWRNERGSLSLELERREFDFVFRTLLSRETRTAEFEADGVGISARFAPTDNVSVYANGMRYDYSRNIALQPNIDVLRLFALSSLSTINSLLDDRVSAGIEVDIGTRMLDVRASTWRTAVFDDRVDSIGIGLLTPAGAASDIEFRLALDDSDGAGRATLFSVFLYFYGD